MKKKKSKIPKRHKSTGRRRDLVTTHSTASATDQCPDTSTTTKEKCSEEEQLSPQLNISHDDERSAVDDNDSSTPPTSATNGVCIVDAAPLIRDNRTTLDNKLLTCGDETSETPSIHGAVEESGEDVSTVTITTAEPDIVGSCEDATITQSTNPSQSVMDQNDKSSGNDEELSQNEDSDSNLQHHHQHILSTRADVIENVTVKRDKIERERELTDVTVVFHVLVAEDWIFSHEEGDRVYVVFGPPVSDWNAEYPYVEMQPCTSLLYAKTCKLDYLVGKMNFAGDHVEQDVPYKYIVQIGREDGQSTVSGTDRPPDGAPLKPTKQQNGQSRFLVWEKIYYNELNSDFNRSLRVPKDIEEFHRFDDVICRPPVKESQLYNRVDDYRMKASLCMLSAITAEVRVIEAEIALQRIKALLESHDSGISISEVHNTSNIRRLRGSDYRSTTSASRMFTSCMEQLDTELMETAASLKDRMNYLIFFCLYKEEIGQVEFKSVQQIVGLLKVFKDLRSQLEMIAQLVPSVSLKRRVAESFITLVKEYFSYLNEESIPDNPWIWLYVLPVLVQLDFLSLWTNCAHRCDLEQWHRIVKSVKLEPYVEQELEDILAMEPTVTEQFLHTLTPGTFKFMLTNHECSKHLARVPYVMLLENYVKVSGPLGEWTGAETEALLKLGRMASEGTDYETQVCTFARALASDPKDQCANLTSFVLDVLHLCSAPRSETLDVYGEVFKNLMDILNDAAAEVVFSYFSKHLLQAQRMGQRLFDVVLQDATAYVHEQPARDCLEFYLDNAHDIHDDFGKVLLNKGYDALELLQVQEKGSKGLLGRVVKKVTHLVVTEERKTNAVHVVEQFVDKSCPLSSSELETVMLVTETDLHRSMIRILHFVGMKSLKKPLQERCSHVYKQISAVLRAVMDQTILVQHFRDVATEERWARLQVLYDILGQYETGAKKQFPKFSSLRTELDLVAYFMQSREDVFSFLDMLKDDLGSQLNLEDVTLRNPADLTLQDICSNLDAVLYFDEEEIEGIKWILESRKKSRIVANMFEAALAAEAIETSSDLGRVFAAISQVSKSASAIAAKIAKGTVTIATVERLFRTNHSPENIVQEVDGLNELFRCRIDRGVTKQIQHVFELGRHQEVATIIRDVCQVLGFKKEFVAVNRIIAAKESRRQFVEQSLSVLTEDLLNNGRVFGKWKEHQVEALVQLSLCGKLLAWVRTNIHSHQQLKVFVDLASISAGESDTEVDRILVFQAALNGYAPMIFDLKDDGRVAHFISQVEALFRNLKADPKLPVYLRDSMRILPWIEEVHNRHGSVEASSLTTVQQINRTGAYLLSAKLVTNGGVRSRSKAELISLEYQPLEKSTEEEPKRTLSYADLEELRSKLMLITAGEEGQKEVDKYTHTLSGVETVAKHLERLLQSGCSLFSQFHVTCYSYPCEVSVLVEFGHKSDIVRAKGFLEHELQGLADFLAQAHDYWTAYIRNVREEYPSSNYYTTDQLLRLSSALASMLYQNRPLSAEATMLLGVAFPNVDDRLLQEVFRLPEVLAEPSVVEEGSDDRIDTLKSTAEFRKLVENFGYGEDVSLACVLWHNQKEVEVSVNELGEWCKTHQDNVDFIKEVLLDLHSGGTVEVANDQEQAAPEANSQDLQPLFKIWKNFLRNVNDIEAEDFISLQTLVAGLQELANRCGARPQRRFPKYLHSGQPNLIVCPEKDAHKIVLALFQSDDAKSLPGLDEVLLCSLQTPAEQVELFCRRAFADDAGKIFVVLHAHLLDFDVSVHVEKLFTVAAQRRDYRLVFVSSKEHNEQSYVSTAFDRYAVMVPNPSAPDVLQTYVARNLEVERGSSAAALDPDRSRFRLLTSSSPGNGKTLMARRIGERNDDRMRTVNLNDDQICFRSVVSKLKNDLGDGAATVVHVDVSANVTRGLGDLLFSLAVLRGLADDAGQVWLCSDADLYLVEVTHLDPAYGLNDVLPTLFCEAPPGVLARLDLPSPPMRALIQDGPRWVPLLDPHIYHSPVFQRPYQYLDLFRRQDRALEHFRYKGPTSREHVLDCLKTLLEFCPVERPSWRELWNFASFLNQQLETTERSTFCNSELTQDILPGFKSFVVKFLIQMSQDFASRSVEISDVSCGDGYRKPAILHRRKWENTPHPYVFFNNDGHTISFFGLHFDSKLSLIAEQTKEVLEREMMTKALYYGLQAQGVIFNKSFRQLARRDVIADLCRVFGVPARDPDPTYELTYDNVMKLLAIYTRFRCNIPVVIMGETGSGKTRLIRFLCDLMRGNAQGPNMLVLKTHGGITEADVARNVDAAVRRATINCKKGVSMTVLFFDEANTTEAIAVVKTVLCDRTSGGRPLPDDVGLQFAAAVNPYREHSTEMIHKLESAGLGYHIGADETADRIGKIPLRRLVYRVKELPGSLFPYVWDFGTLDAATESIYIAQMIAQRGGRLPPGASEVLLATLSESQKYMREQKDECSFVSLRDVERALTLFRWFETKRERVHAFLRQKLPLDPFVISLVLALGVAYYVRLEDRGRYVARVAQHFLAPYALGLTEIFAYLIGACQDLFVNELHLEPNIARNDALKENVWMMAICIELKIPLFLVGKPGSSKSLAKTVVTDVMQGQQSYSDLFRTFKEIHMVSFQCSPLATAGGILGTFRQCQKFQQERDLSKFVSVVVLDEVGLAEDSPKMPLKTLHPLLEDGCVSDEEPQAYKKVAFVGLSNWALDPAKMNRGILVSRGVPTRQDLVESARSICAHDNGDRDLMVQAIRRLTDGYCHVYEKQDREYFGLRDFYTVVKMALAVAQKERREPTDQELQKCVQRNFGGYFGDFDPALAFLKHVKLEARVKTLTPSKDLVLEAISDQSRESRYILLLTKNNVALRILQDQDLLDQNRTLVLFGSSFPHDQEYTQICRNINRIKMAMELGQTVVLCNLTNLYESLYDALNQNYVLLGGRRYVDLGLGTHRVKCRVHEAFRLIVVAEDREVYDKFPVPLINRLEKHFLGMETLVSAPQLQLVHRLKEWVQRFCQVRLRGYECGGGHQFAAADAIVGYHDDVIASLVMRHWASGSEDEVSETVKKALLWCATPDSISRLTECVLSPQEADWCFRTYHFEQLHGCLSDFLRSIDEETRLVQVTTSSHLLTYVGKESIAGEMGLNPHQVTLLSLQQFDTEEQFCNRVKQFLGNGDGPNPQYLFVQAEVTPNSSSLNLVECARFVVQDLVRDRSQGRRIVFLLHVPRVSGGCFTGMSVQPWIGCHIDELRKGESQLQCDVAQLENVSIASLFESGLADVKRLLTENVPKAASTVANTDATRVQRRIDHLMDVLECPSDFNSSLLRVLHRIVADALKFRELQVPEPTKWLTKLALGNRHLKEGHTFQRSIWLHLCDVVTPILTDIIAVCDADYGLDFLAADGVNPVLRDVYVELLCRCPLSDLPRMAEHGLSLEARFPFSRFLVERLRWWHEKKLDALEDPTSASLQALVDASSLAEPLQWAFCFGCSLLERYLSDFVDLTFPVLKTNVTKEVLCLQMGRLANDERRQRLVTYRSEVTGRTSSDNTSEVCSHAYVTPADVQLAYFNNRLPLGFLCSVVAFVPDVAPRLSELLRGDVTADVAIHVRAFLWALERLEPKADELLMDNLRRRFCANVTKAASLLRHVTSLGVAQLNHAVREKMEEDLRRLEILRLYVQHMEHCDHDAFPVLFSRLKRLNLMLKKNNLKTKDEFQKLLDFLNIVNTDVSKHHFAGGNDVCIICQEDLESPVELPCKHVACRPCLAQYLKRPEEDADVPRKCPQDGCAVDVPRNFDLHCTLASKESVEKHRRFKQCLTAFFLDVLQRHVLGGTHPADPAVVDTLMSFVVSKELPKDRPERERTKKLSPFAGHAIDATPTIRSFVLQLLLQGHRWETTFEYMTLFLEQKRRLVPEPRQYLELLLLVVYCLEDHYFRNSECVLLGRYEVVAPHVAVDCLKSARLDQKWERLAAILSDVARVRLAMHTIAVVLYEHLRDPSAGNKSLDFLERVQTMMGRLGGMASAVKKLLVRTLMALFRKDFVIEWKRSSRYLGLMPEELLNASWVSETDTYLVLGGRYKTVRNAASKALATDNYDELVALLYQEKDVRFEWFCGLYYLRHVGRFTMNNARHLVEALQEQFAPLATIARDILLIDVDALRRLFPCATGRQNSILVLLHHLLALNASGIWQKHPLTELWQRISANPVSVRLYPTMPQDDTVEVRRGTVDVTTWYQCPKGHQYGIGNCGQPSEVGQCPTCKEPIGGQRHIFVHSGQQTGAAVATDSTKYGHLLGTAMAHARSLRVRGLNGLQVALTRFLLHASMALSCLKDVTWAKRVVEPRVQGANLPEFLMQHLELNLEQIATQLGRNEDAAQLLLHHVMCRMSLKQLPDVALDATLNTKAQREAWESAFAGHVLEPEVAALERSLVEMANAAKAEQNAADNALFAIMHERPDVDGPLELVTQTAFWIPRERITLESVVHKIGEDELKRSSPNFFRLLTHEPVLSEMANLPAILELMALLVAKFDGRIDRNVTLMTKISDFFYNKAYFTSDMERKHVIQLTQTFLNCFNNIRNQLPRVGLSGEKAIAALDGRPLSMDSPADVLFPSAHDLGQCSVALVQLLVAEHDGMLRRFLEEQRHDSEELAPQEVLLAEVTVDHLITFDRSGLHLLLLYHSEYNLDVDKQTQWRLNKEGLEQSIIERYFIGRPLIAGSLAVFHYRNEKRRGGPLVSVIPQEKLSEAARHQLGVQLRRLVDTCSLLSLVEIARDLLLVTGGKPDDSLLDEMNKLRLKPTVWKRVLKPLCLKHVDDVVDVLRLLRARQLLYNKQDPFDFVADIYKGKLDEAELRNISTSLTRHFKIDVLLAWIHRFILERLCRADPDPTEGVFVEYMSAYLEDCDETDLATKFAAMQCKSLKNRHLIDVFNNLVLLD